MELEVAIKPDLAATLLYAIESDLAGAAGTPGELDNIALSSLTLWPICANCIRCDMRICRSLTTKISQKGC